MRSLLGVRFDALALGDLKRIRLFITIKFSEATAQKSLYGVVERVEGLRSWPRAGRIVRISAYPDVEVRVVSKGKSRIYYTITHNNIYVLRILDTRQNPLV